MTIEIHLWGPDPRLKPLMQKSFGDTATIWVIAWLWVTIQVVRLRPEIRNVIRAKLPLKPEGPAQW